MNAEPPAWLRALSRERPCPAVRYQASASSSNDLARGWLDQGGPDGLLVVVGEQVAGRGRRGRRWQSPPGLGLYVSVGLRPRLEAQQAYLLTFLAAVAVAEGLRALQLAAEIRWPNDVDVRGRKLSGILAETRLEGARIVSAVLGLGINVGARIPVELAGRATSVGKELGREVPPGDVLGPVLSALDRRYAALGAGHGSESLLAAWRSLSPGHRGCPVEVDTGDERFAAVTDGLEPDGALRVRRDDGRRMAIRLGEVARLRRR